MVNKVTPWNTYFGVIYKPTPCRRLCHSPQSIHFHRDVTSFFTGFYREVALRAKASKGGINWQAGKIDPVEPHCRSAGGASRIISLSTPAAECKAAPTVYQTTKQELRQYPQKTNISLSLLRVPVLCTLNSEIQWKKLASEAKSHVTFIQVFLFLLFLYFQPMEV